MGFAGIVGSGREVFGAIVATRSVLGACETGLVLGCKVGMFGIFVAGVATVSTEFGLWLVKGVGIKPLLDLVLGI